MTLATQLELETFWRASLIWGSGRNDFCWGRLQKGNFWGEMKLLDHPFTPLDGDNVQINKWMGYRARYKKTFLVCVLLSTKVNSVLMVWITNSQVPSVDSVLKNISRKLTSYELSEFLRK